MRAPREVSVAARRVVAERSSRGDCVAAQEGDCVAARKPYTGPVVVICGPTGSGKTGAAIELAKKLGETGEIFGEVISADSRAIYKYMDIGTAKPSVQEREGVPHFGFDLVLPGERFTVADWKEYAEKCIQEIRERGNVPIVAGGTGLYIDALVFGYEFRGKTGEASRAKKEFKSGAGAEIEQKSCSTKTGVSEEFEKMYPDRVKMRPGFLVYGIEWGKEALRERLMKREQKMYSEELFAETRFLVERYGWDSQAMKSNIYQFAWKYLQGECSREEAIQQSFYDDWHLVRRQMTWFRRNSEIKWLSIDEIVPEIIKDLYKK